jgi:hypothetical protein
VRVVVRRVGSEGGKLSVKEDEAEGGGGRRWWWGHVALADRVPR